MYSQRLLKTCITMLALACVLNTHAQEWETSGTLELKAHQTSNPRLDVTESEDQDTDTLETHETLNLVVKRGGRNTDLTVRAQAQFVQFSQSDILEDEENQRLNVFGVYRPTENTTYSVYTHYAHENYSARTAVETLDQGVGDDPPPDGDPSIVSNQEQFRIDRIIMIPTALWQISARSAIQLQVDHRQNDFSNEQRLSLADYGSTTGRVEWIYSLSESRLDYIKFNVGYVDYRSDGLIDRETEQVVNQFDGTGIPVNVAYQRTFKNGLYAVFSAGALQIDIEEQGIDSETEAIFGIYVGNTDSEQARHKYFVSYNDYINPNSSGVLLKSQIFRAGYEYKLSRQSRIGIDGLFFENEQQSGAFLGSQQEYFNIEPHYTWEIGRSMELSLRYRYRDLQREGQGNDSGDHAFTVGFTYKLWD